jgi:acetylornithine deacetylase/succinyl-diaminopimelate desuccinylase-like protein
MIPFMDQSTVHDAVTQAWDTSALPSLSGLVAIPALSPGFDAAWAETGHLRAAAEHVRDWIASRDLPGARLEILELPGRSPLLVVDVPATEGAATQGTVVLYGHLDKQPPAGGWSDGLDAWTPVIRGGRLYGRGAVDDGYAGYAATLALEAVHAAGGEHARAVLLLETGEESGSPDLPAYMEHLAASLGEVSLVLCLDAGGGDYERLWLTNSLRGAVQATVTVTVLTTGVHSGLASGIVPSSFRILRALLERIEDSATGAIKLASMNVEIPADRRAEAEELARFDPGAAKRHPFAEGVSPVSDDDVELILNNTWRPTLSLVGASGMPEPAAAGAVLRPSTSLKLSFRLPPTADPQAALAELKQVLTTNVPYNAQVRLDDIFTLDGWNAPALAPWLSDALDRVGDSVIGKRHQGFGIGGGIPFMSMLAERYPNAQFLVTGAIGADSNMHVPDEWLNIPFAQKVTEAVAHVLDAHAQA